MNRLVFIIFCFLNSFLVSGQASWLLNLPRSMNPQDTLDWAKVCVHYRQAVRMDTLKPDEFTFSEMILQVGDRVSEYTNWVQLYSDSIMRYELEHTNINSEKVVDDAVARTRKCGDNQTVFKNYPTGKCSVQTRVFIDKFLYEEVLPRYDWKLESGTSTWLGYDCRKASCTFRGRHYVVWYAPGISISNGPWKFGGLPGLILKVEDSRGDYISEATALYKVNWERPIYKGRSTGEMKTTREKLMKAEKHWAQNPAAVIQNSGKVLSAPNEEVKRKILPYNPMERE